MSYLLKGATLISLDPPKIDKADLRIEGGRIVDRRPELAQHGEELIDLRGKAVMAGMVCAHTHLYSTLARGMPGPPRPPANFLEVLELVWWRLDRALDDESVYWSALAGALDAARVGTTCLFDHHASPSSITGSLQVVREAIETVGLRGVLCYEVTDRGGAAERDEGIKENSAFLDWVASNAGLFRGMVGGHASFTLSDRSLDACADLMRAFGAGLHIHVAEDAFDVEDTREKHRTGVVERLAGHNALNDRTILAHATHLDEREVRLARDAGAWLAHNPRSNLNNRVGYAPVAGFGDRMVLGTDGIGADLFEESRFAFLKNQEERAGVPPQEWLRVLARNQALASQTFGMDLRSLESGSAADLAILDYDPPTPITTENIAGHFMFGLSSAAVESVMVDGRFVIRDRQSTVDGGEVAKRARQVSAKLWARLR